MKKVLLILLAVASLTACKQKDKKVVKTTATPAFYLDAETAIVNWVGYKFTDKKGVKGIFKQVSVSNTKGAASIQEALNGVKVSIPVSSVFSSNEIRDNKLRTLFFGVMEHTELLSGTVTSVKNNTGIISLTMNNETHDLPFTLQIEENKTVYLKATIDLNTWHAEKALASLHTACELLHTGKDGISKTWNTVDVNAILKF